MVGAYIAGLVVVLLGASAFFGAPYVPSRRRDLREMFDNLVPVGDGDVVLDIGSGDGVVLREASRRGARAVGYEIHPLFVMLSKMLSRGNTRVRVHWANAWTASFPADVTLVYIFSVGRDGNRVVQKVQREANQLGRSVRLVCYGNPLPGRTATASQGAYYLYTFHPLHSS